GNITSQTETIENEFKYAGQIYDSETGLYYLRARYYDPTTGRFISKDSNEGSIVNPLSLNLYTYCENDPLGNIDPTGHNPIIWALYAYATAIANSPDTQQDFILISNDMVNQDYLSAGLDLVGLLVPGGTGFGQLSKPIRNAIIWLSENTGKSVDEILEMVNQSNKVSKGPGNNAPKNIYNSIKDAPKYPEGFKGVQNGTKKVNINSNDILNQLKQVESGQWKKVYKDGFDANGNKVSIHYFESPSGKVFDVKVKTGWSNQ
ncbi:MAG: RHS repeat-associated core domain-containing protein, partial [Syntrophomonadaceae bacterium]|nr:RHS repeat-associated core domain-containing protein [Syntrophomonadaceae bacterium]